jgi:virginiamycin B lyase
MSSRTDAGRLNRSGAGAGPIRGAIVVALLSAVALLLPVGAQASIFWGNNPLNCGPGGCFSYGTIGHANPDGTGVNQSFIKFINPYTGPDVGGVAVDGSHVYWTNVTGGAIGRAKLDGTGVNWSFITGASDPASDLFGAAVDGPHVYWTNLTDGTIGRAKLDGTGVNQSFISGASAPFGVAVDGSHVYWANAGNNAIGRANLNATGANQSFITGGSDPRGVAVDGSHVYWTNTGLGTIGRAKLDGTGVNQSFIGGASAPFGVAVDGSHVYWTNAPGTIGRAKLDGTGVNRSFITGASSPIGVAVDSLTSHYRPDGLIKRHRGASFIGGGIYNTTARGQTKKSRARRGHTRVFDLKLQNDGDTSDALDVNGCQSSKGFTVSYWQVSAGVTSRVASGRYSTGTLAPGAGRTLAIKVKVAGTAAHGAVKRCRITATSHTDPTRKDAVEGQVKVR